MVTGQFSALRAVLMLSWMVVGCSPYSTIAKIGIKVVGDAVNDADVEQKSKEYVGQPVAAADAGFGQRIRTLEELQTKRQMITYPVKDDLLEMFRWTVEGPEWESRGWPSCKQPDGGKDIAEKLVLTSIVEGKTPEQIQSHDWFKKLVLTLRDCSNGHMIRVYDTSIIPNFMGAKYCVLEFDETNRCQSIRIVGVAAKSPGSILNQ
jgi:hypothetical protein